MQHKPIFLVACLLITAVPSSAQDFRELIFCGQSGGPPAGHYKTIELGNHQTSTFDGGEGLDVFSLDGATHRIAGRGLLKNVERIDMLNSQFNTVLLLGDFVHSGQHGEVDVILDTFDTVVLDPTLSWQMTKHPSGAFDEYSSTYEGDPIKVLVAPNSYVISNPPPVIAQTVTGADGSLVWPSERSTVPALVTYDLTTAQVTWSDAGAVNPYVRLLNPDIEKVTLNVQNGQPNLVKISQAGLGSQNVGEVTLIADPFDTLLISDPQCWTSEDDESSGIVHLTNKVAGSFSANVILPRKLFRTAARKDWRVGTAVEPGVWLLSNDTRVALDTIDIRNGGSDILILRNDGRLRARHDAIFGDTGDEIWLEGTAGWSIAEGPYGTLAKVPNGFDDISPNSTISFSPGMIVRVLPEPNFLFDESLLELTHYPGALDRAFKGKRLIVTRGGFVSFSANQMSTIEKLSIRNGIRNTLHLHPDKLETKTGELVVHGDAELDTVVVEDFPQPKLNENGDSVWLLERDSGTLEVTVEGLDIIQN